MFGSKRRLSNVPELNISCNNVKLAVTTCVKYLGTYVDNCLSGTDMFDYVIKKINGTIKFLYRNKSFLDMDVRKMLVNSLIQPRFDYSCNLWYRPIGKTKQSKLQRCQNKCIRYILGLPNKQHLDFAHFKKLKYLNVEKRVEYLTLCNMYSIVNGSCPDYLKDLIQFKSHHHYTRKSTKSVFQEHIGSNGKLSFYYNGSKLWNDLDNDIKMCKNKSSFKFKCKKFLTQSMEKAANCDFIYY